MENFFLKLYTLDAHQSIDICHVSAREVYSSLSSQVVEYECPFPQTLTDAGIITILSLNPLGEKLGLL